MATIPIPFIISDNGIADSILKTAGLWGILIIVFVVSGVIYGVLKGEIALPRFNITPRKVIAAVLIAAAGIVAFTIHPLLLLPLLVAVLIVLAYLEVKSVEPKRDSADNDRDPVSRGLYSRPGKHDDRVIDAEFRVMDEPKKEKQARPVTADRVPDTAGRKRAEEQRSLYEEQKKREQEQKLRAREIERQQYIHGLSAGNFPEYLQEAEKFRKEFGKNVQCDVCGRWDGELSVQHNQTYCPQCLPRRSHR